MLFRVVSVFGKVFIVSIRLSGFIGIFIVCVIGRLVVMKVICFGRLIEFRLIIIVSVVFVVSVVGDRLML